MARTMKVAAAQMGPIARDESRQEVVSRLLDMMREAADWGADVVVFPELALTTFFPRWVIDDEDEIDSWYEREMPNAAVAAAVRRSQAAGDRFPSGICRTGVRRRWHQASLQYGHHR